MTDGLLSVNTEELLNREKERDRERGRESWHCPELLCLSLIERRIYLVPVFLLECSITLLIDVHSVLVLLCLQRLASPSLCFPPCILLLLSLLLIPQSDCDRWRSRLPRQWLPPLLVFSCAPSNRQCQGAPHEFPAPGSDPIPLGRLR